MSTKELIRSELDHVPDAALEEILDFVRFLKAKAAAERLGDAVASESSLKKDWLTPEEEQAWSDL